MARLSVNVNKVATLRNARGGEVPSVIEAVRVILGAGCRGITVHPRADERHIRRADAIAIAAELEPLRDVVEYNIEGDPRPDLVDLVCQLRPHQCTLVPVKPGEITSQAGWPASTDPAEIGAIVRRIQAVGVRVSMFVDAEEAPSASSCTPSPSPSPSRRGRALPPARASPPRPAWPTSSASASTPATTSTSTTSCCSAACRTSTRSRSATR